MKWTPLRLNMLPITAVEVQYACQTLTNLHNSIVDHIQKQNYIQQNIKTKSKALFTPAQYFVPLTLQKSNPFNQTSNQQITHQKLILQYQKLKQSIKQQIFLLNFFYVKNSHDSAAPLFHMLKLKLQRLLFDCNTDKKQMKKVLTKSQQEFQYQQIAKQFQSNQSQNNYKIHSQSAQLKSQSLQQKSIQQPMQLQNQDTFKTQNYAGYQTQQNENEFLNYQEDDSYQRLNFDLKPQNKKISNEKQYNMKKQQKYKKSVSPLMNKQKSKKQIKQINTKTPKKNQPSSQITIATQNQKTPKNTKIIDKNKNNINKIKGDTNSYKNLKILTNNNLLTKTFKPQIQSKIRKQSFSNTYTNLNTGGNLNKGLLNQKDNKISDKSKGYSALNQKKQQQKRKILGNENETKKGNTSFIKGQHNLYKQDKSSKLIQKNIKTQQMNNKKGSPRKQIKIEERSKQRDKSGSKSKQISKNNKKQQQKQQIDLKKILLQSGSQLRFTIKMSRQQYKSLLQMKNKMTKQNT